MGKIQKNYPDQICVMTMTIRRRVWLGFEGFDNDTNDQFVAICDDSCSSFAIENGDLAKKNPTLNLGSTSLIDRLDSPPINIVNHEQAMGKRFNWQANLGIDSLPFQTIRVVNISQRAINLGPETTDMDWTVENPHGKKTRGPSFQLAP